MKVICLKRIEVNNSNAAMQSERVVREGYVSKNGGILY